MPAQRWTVEFSGQLGAQVIVWIKKQKKQSARIIQQKKKTII